MTKTVNPTYVQTTHRFVDDNAANNSATLLGSNGDDRSYAPSATIRIRFLVDQTDAATTDLTVTPQLHYSYNSGSYTLIGEPTDTDAPIRVKAIANITDGTATTQRISAGSFVAGTLEDSASSWASVTFTNGSASQTEWEIALEIYSGYSGLANGDTIDLRVYRSGAVALNGGYTDTPRITVAMQTASPTTGTGTFSGKQPTVSISQNIGVTVGTGTFAGNSPELQFGYHGNLLLFGLNLEVSGAVTRSPSVGTLTLAGQQPVSVPTANQIIPVSAGSGTFAGNQPTSVPTDNQSRAPTTGSGSFAGQQPDRVQTENQFRDPSTYAGTFAGQAPDRVQTDNQFANPTTATGTFAGNQPTVQQTHSAAPSTYAAVLSGQQPDPVTTEGANKFPAAGTLTLAGQAPTVQQTHSAALGTYAATLAGQQPAVDSGDSQTRAPDTGTLTAAGQAPTPVQTDHQIIPVGAGTVTIAGNQPDRTQTAHQIGVPGSLGVLLAGQQPTPVQTAHQLIPVTTGTGTFTGQQPDPVTSAAGTVQPAVGTALLSGQVPTVSAPLTLYPSVGTGTFTGYAPSVSTVAPAPEAQQPPAGSRKRKKRPYVVTIDGQDFLVNSVEEARQLLERARRLAETVAPQQAQEKIVALKRATKLGKAPIRLKTPKVWGPAELQPEIQAARREIESIYRQAALDAELALLIALQQEADDEEAILLSL